ncbi:hypothetical protein GGR58DRAFT_488789 [Xylaria digitata]|nr:hypothetical protein GGR58DRAFT_488789 [Xylaria digitata]
MRNGTMEGSITLAGFLAAEIVVLSAASLFVFIRLWANFRLNKCWLVDDYVSIFSVLLLGATAGLYYPTLAWIDDPSVDAMTLSRVATATYFISAYSNFTAKATIFLLYRKLFGSKVWVRRTVYITLSLGFLGYTATSVLGTVENVIAESRSNMVPASELLNDPFYTQYFRLSYAIAVANASFNLAIDIIAFILPIPIVYELHLPTRKKIGLALLFASGIVAIASGAVSLHYRRSSSAESVGDLTIVIIFTILDSAIGIMLATVPAIRSLWVDLSSELGLFTKLGSIFSSSRTASSTSHIRSMAHGRGGDSDSITRTFNYFELEQGGIAKTTTVIVSRG